MLRPFGCSSFENPLLHFFLLSVLIAVFEIGRRSGFHYPRFSSWFSCCWWFLYLGFFSSWSGVICSLGRIRFARQVLHLDRLIIEGDSATIVSWIRQAPRASVAHPIIRDIGLLLQGCAYIAVRHIYREANLATDWVASFVAHHTSSFVWSDWHFAPEQFRNVILSDYLACIHFCSS